MSFLDSVFLINNEGGATEHVFAGIGVAFALGGAYLMASALFPQYKWTFKVKNSVGVNLTMFSFHTLVAFLFLAGAILLCLGAGKKIGWGGWGMYGSGIVFTLLNLYGFLGNAYIVYLKLSHSFGAKKAGVSESEYYEKFVAPRLKK